MALTRILLSLISLIILSSCVQDPQGFLRKSANNKYFDMKGFHESKRLPVYNAKYIERAKQNILSTNYGKDSREEAQVDEPDEVESPRAYHREIYKQMAIGDGEHKPKQSKVRKKHKNFFSKIASRDIEEINNDKISSRSVKIHDPLETKVKKLEQVQKKKIIDDFGDEEEYDISENLAFVDQNIFSEDLIQEKIEKISAEFKEEKMKVDNTVTKELASQKEQLKKEFEEMKAMLKSPPITKEQKVVEVKEIVGRELEIQKQQLKAELKEMKEMLGAIKQQVSKQVSHSKEYIKIALPVKEKLPSKHSIKEIAQKIVEYDNNYKPLEAHKSFFLY